jgi:hypothetical protein
MQVGVALPIYCGQYITGQNLDIRVLVEEDFLMENDNKEKNKPDENGRSNDQILSLIISGYRFDNDWINLLLNHCYGIPAEKLILNKIMMGPASPARNEEKAVDMIDEEKPNEESIFSPDSHTINLDKDEANKNIPLLFGSIFYKDENNLLFSGGKVGKSKLSMEVAKNPLIKRPVFILREDYTGRQVSSYKAIVGDKAILISLCNWHDMDAKIRQEQTNAAQREILLRYTNSNYRKYQNITEQVFSKSGLKNGQDKFDDIAVFQAIVTQEISNGADFICLDSLNALIGEKVKITRTMIERIFKPMMGSGVTFLLIHHENANGKVYGSVDLANSFDHIYHYRLISKSPELDILLLDEQSRDTDPKRLTISRTWNNNIPKYTILADSIPDNEVKDLKPKSCADQIASILSPGGEEVILFENLIGKINNISKGTLKNSLKALEEKGLVKKTDGKTWRSITNLARN